MGKTASSYFLDCFDWILFKLACNIKRTFIKAWMSLHFGQIPPLTTELHVAAIDRLKMDVTSIDLILFKLAGNEDMHNILDEFDFRPDWTTCYRDICPRTSKNNPRDL